MLFITDSFFYLKKVNRNENDKKNFYWPAFHINVDDVLKENQSELNSHLNLDQTNATVQLDSGENPTFDEIKKSLKKELT